MRSRVDTPITYYEYYVKTFTDIYLYCRYSELALSLLSHTHHFWLWRCSGNGNVGNVIVRDTLTVRVCV